MIHKLNTYDATRSNASMTEEELLNQPSSQKRCWAYVFLLADIDPDRASYRGMLYNVMVATYSLKYHQPDLQPPSTKYDSNHTTTNSRSRASQADIIVLLQMSESTNHTRLPTREEELLRRLRIQPRYLPKPVENNNYASSSSSSFYQLVMAKFHVWDLIDYTRVIFLDSDVLPLCPLDYLMELSETQQLLKQNVLHAMYDDPVNAGLFMVTPNRTHFQELQRLIQNNNNNNRHGTKSKNLSSSSWTTTSATPDYRLWKSLETKRGWDFYCADSDQGLLLYWSRFVRQQVSILVGPTIEHYDGEGPPAVVPSRFLSQYSCLLPPPVASSSSGGVGRKNTFAQNVNERASLLPVYQDFFHMVGYSKAWEMPLTRPVPTQISNIQSSWEYWYFLLDKVKRDFDVDGVIPALESLSRTLEKPKLRGDLFAVKN
jgi:hypothetical protein